MLDQDVKIAPSVLAADFTRLGDELESIACADLVHYDVMDGHFVPNLSYGTKILSDVKRATSVPVDAHLMVANPEVQVPWFLEAGADIVTFHMEAQTHAHRLCGLIRDAGAKASVAINPGTPVSALDAIITEVDMVLVMSVNPGFGGQSFIDGTLDKLRELRALCARRHVSPMVEVDGGVSAANVEAVAAAGANVIVAGSGVFRCDDRAAAIDELRQGARRALARRA